MSGESQTAFGKPALVEFLLQPTKGASIFSVPFSKSEQCSDLGGWLCLGKVAVQISSRKKNGTP